MGFQDVAFEIGYTPHFLVIVMEVKASGPPYVLELWSVVSKGVLPVKYFSSNRNPFCVSLFFEDHKTVTKLG